MAQEAVKVMESFMPIYIRYSAAAFQPCIRFTLSPDKPRVGKEPLTVFNEAASPKYREMFQQLNYTSRNRIPALGTGAVEKLLKPLGLSVDKFFGIIQCESRAEEETQDDGSYPSKTALQQLFGYSAEWANVKNVLTNQMGPPLAQVNRNAELLYEEKAKLEEIHKLLCMMADISNLRSKNVEVPNTGSGKPENKPELRVLLKSYYSKKSATVTGPPADPEVSATVTGLSADVTDSADMKPGLETEDPLMDEAEI